MWKHRLHFSYNADERSLRDANVALMVAQQGLIFVDEYRCKNFSEQTSFLPAQCIRRNLLWDFRGISMQSKFIFDIFSIFYDFSPIFALKYFLKILPLLKNSSSFFYY